MITVKGQGQSLGDLGNTDNLIIRGHMDDGIIHIPNTELNFVEASGEVVISHAILEGENLQAHLGNSWVRNSKLKLGLTGDVMPLHVETDVRVDLSQLPPILKRLIDDKDFQKELTLQKELKGSANAKLILGGDTDHMKVRVEATDIHLSARYQRLPYPLQITAGELSYNENHFKIKQLSGKLILKEVSLDASIMKAAGYGVLDLHDEKIDVDFLVAPLKTMDRVLDHIPLPCFDFLPKETMTWAYIYDPVF